MMRRFSVFRSFQSTPASRGQQWLPLVALALVSLECNAAVDGEARVQVSRQQTQLAQLQNQVRTLDTWRAEFQTQSDQLQIRYDGLYDVQKDLNTLLVSLHEEHAKLSGEYTGLHGTHQELQDRFTLILAQVQTLSDEQRHCRAETCPGGVRRNQSRRSAAAQPCGRAQYRPEPVCAGRSKYSPTTSTTRRNASATCTWISTRGCAAWSSKAPPPKRTRTRCPPSRSASVNWNRPRPH